MTILILRNFVKLFYQKNIRMKKLWISKEEKIFIEIEGIVIIIIKILVKYQ